jgi:galactonate dehydratase
MQSAERIRRIVLRIPVISSKTKWAFIEVEASSGAIGTGEATLTLQEAALATELQELGPALLGQPADPVVLIPLLDPLNLPRAAIISALDQALSDLCARRSGISLCAMIGQKRDTVGLYANINRGTWNRAPEGFAASAQRAVDAGFHAVKIAPFDEVTPDNASLEMAAPGLSRIAAVKAMLPDHVALYVDCHWRFTPSIAAEMVAPLRERGVSWYECPLVEVEENIPALRALRHQAQAAGMVLVGLEKGVGSGIFETFARGGAYDVMMPDIKYIGGIDMMMRTGEALRRHGVGISPHNPTGPICHAASLAICGALEMPGLLELQFDETPYFDRLVGGVLEAPKAGLVAVPNAPGLGVALDDTVMAELPGEIVTIA